MTHRKIVVRSCNNCPNRHCIYDVDVGKYNWFCSSMRYKEIAEDDTGFPSRCPLEENE